MFGVADTIKPLKQLDPQKVKFWLAEVDSSEKRKLAEMMKRNNYPDLIKYYEGEQNAKANTQTKLAILNDYFPNTNALLVEIMYQDPEVQAEASKPFRPNSPIGQKFNQSFPQNSEVNPEMVMKSALQYGLKKTDSIMENRIALFDMLYAGICFVEVDHSTEKISNPDIEQERNLIDKTIDNIQSLSKEQIEEEEAKKSPDKTDAYAMREKTYIRRWSPLDAGIDYRADRIKDARFVYKIVRYSQAEFNAKYPEYKDKVRPGIDIQYSEHRDPDHKRTVTTYEIQVKRKDDNVDVITIAPSFPNEEIDFYQRPYKTNGFNLKVGTLDEYGRLYPISRAKINRAMQDNTNDYATFMMEVAERNIPKRWYNKLKVKGTDLAALNSPKVNDNVGIDGGGGESIGVVPATNVSIENKELLAIFQKKREELWGVSATRLSGKGNAEFMGELQIQEAGFQERRIGIQEGLRRLYKEELDTLKDIIVSFWDDEYFFKITGAAKPAWYLPQTDPLTGMVLNPLTDILTADYEVDIDIISALKPNKERRKKELVEYLTWLLSPVMTQYFMTQGKQVAIDAIKRTAVDFGLNPETLLIDVQPSALSMGGLPAGGPSGADLGVVAGGSPMGGNSNPLL